MSSFLALAAPFRSHNLEKHAYDQGFLGLFLRDRSWIYKPYKRQQRTLNMLCVVYAISTLPTGESHF